MSTITLITSWYDEDQAKPERIAVNAIFGPAIEAEDLEKLAIQHDDRFLVLKLPDYDARELSQVELEECEAVRHLDAAYYIPNGETGQLELYDLEKDPRQTDCYATLKIQNPEYWQSLRPGANTIWVQRDRDYKGFAPSTA